MLEHNKTLPEEIMQSTQDHFFPKNQLKLVKELIKGEEGDFFKETLIEIAEIILKMPVTFEARDDESIVHLHYFNISGAGDWYITEKDCLPEQHQAFGVVSLGNYPDTGYISIEELINHPSIELDFHWKPKTVAALLQELVS